MVNEKIAQSYEREYEIALNPNHPEHLMPDVPYHVRSILEVGCGAGSQLAAIHQRYPHVTKLVGVDVDESAIAWGRTRWPHLTLFALRAEEMFMMARYYDLVMSRRGLAYMDLPRVLPLMVQGLRPYGRLWLVTATWRAMLRDLWTGRFFCARAQRPAWHTERQMRTLLEQAGCRGITYHRRGVRAVSTAEGR